MSLTTDSSDRDYDADPHLSHFCGHNPTCYALQNALCPQHASGTPDEKGQVVSSAESPIPAVLSMYPPVQETLGSTIDLNLFLENHLGLDLQPITSHGGNPTPEAEPFVSRISSGFPPATVKNEPWYSEDYRLLEYKIAAVGNVTPQPEANSQASSMITDAIRRPEHYGSQLAIAHQSSTILRFESPVPSSWSWTSAEQTSTETPTVWLPGVPLHSEPEEGIDNVLTSVDASSAQTRSPSILAARQHSLRGVRDYQNRSVAQSTTYRNRSSNSPYPTPSSSNNHHNHTAMYECQWLDDHGLKCGALISWAHCPTHLACHGIKNKSSWVEVLCRWDGCQLTMKRESIGRHVRERHLHVKRASGSVVGSSPRPLSRMQSNTFSNDEYVWNGTR